MAVVEFRLPDIGEGVTEGEIVEWRVRVGDTVKEDDPMVEVLTDKASVTIGAPCDGTIAELRFEVGSVARVGQVLLTLQADTSPSAVTRRARSSAPPATAVGTIADRLPGADLLAGAAAPGAVLAAPAVRHLAKSLGVDLGAVAPTGPGGRITAEDVRAAAEARDDGGASGPDDEERIPIRGVRRRIAERMQRATRTAAHYTFVEECDASALVALRERLEPEAERRGVKLTFLPFVLKATAETLKGHPKLNASVDEERGELVYKKRYDVGVATATEAGLVVPVVRGVDRLDVFSIAHRVEQLSAGAREGRLRPDDLRGSTFTVTSLGKRSGLFATPILNHPEVAILGVHRIREQPVVRSGEVVVGRVLWLSLSFDHRVVDGHEGAAFAYDLIDRLENPERLLPDDF